MPDFEFIHSSEDTAFVLKLAIELGLTIRHDFPTELPKPDLVDADRVATFKRGVFMLTKPEWIFGPAMFLEIEGGYNKGKLSQSPDVNQISICLYFGGERSDNGVNRLGGGFVSLNPRWYDKIDRTINSTPFAVRSTYNQIVSRISTRHVLIGGVHKYNVLARAWDKLISQVAIPPFDYIEWPPNDEGL